LIPYDRVRDALRDIAENVDTEPRQDGIAFRHGFNRGRPFDFAILKKMGTNEAFVRLTRFRIRNNPKQPLSDTNEAVQVPIQNIQGLDIMLCLARYSLSLNEWILVDSTSPIGLAKLFCYSEGGWNVSQKGAVNEHKELEGS
jgi:hypothetical protein